MMTPRTTLLLLSTILLSAPGITNALVSNQPQTNRRAFMSASTAAVTAASLILINTNIAPAQAAEDNAVLTDNEMAARIARKKELLQRSKSGDNGPPAAASDIRSDVNPNAGVNLRNRSLGENAKVALEKQNELAKRNKKQKGEDMCEMLGRGC
jgi:hypothetical protein